MCLTVFKVSTPNKKRILFNIEAIRNFRMKPS